jgi:hypothetical protein
VTTQVERSAVRPVREHRTVPAPHTRSVAAGQPGSAVSWTPVVILAAVLAYGDGFWVVAMRGAAGAIERTDAPFLTWVRESTLLVPVFVAAVLGASVLAQRWHRSGPVLGLLVVAAGTTVGASWLTGSSAYDYRLETHQLQAMGVMHGMCTGDCLARLSHATLALQEKAVIAGVGLILVTNLLLVVWVVAWRGGRLRLTRPRATAGQRSRRDDVVAVTAVALLASAVVHLAVVPEHLTEWPAAAVFFVALALAETGAAALLVARSDRAVLAAAALVSFAPLVLWTVSRTAGMPFGPEAGVPEAIGVADIAACVLEVISLAGAWVLLRASGRPDRVPVAPHQRALVVVALVAVAAIGLGGSGLGWTHSFGVDGEMMSTTH